MLIAAITAPGALLALVGVSDAQMGFLNGGISVWKLDELEVFLKWFLTGGAAELIN